MAPMLRKMKTTIKSSKITDLPDKSINKWTEQKKAKWKDYW